MKSRTKSKKRKASKKPSKKQADPLINRPEWNSLTTDMDKYKLSQSDLVRGLISKITMQNKYLFYLLFRFKRRSP
jgi:hypothetical protein